MDIATSTTILGADLVSWISQYGYLILLPLFVIEGPVVGIISGILVSFGALQFWPVYLLYISGTLISDSVLYYISRSNDKRLQKLPIFSSLLDRVHGVVDRSGGDWRESFRKNYFSLMVFTRLAPVNLISQFVVITAGILRVPEKKFYPPILLSQPIWSGVIIAAGFFFGDIFVDPQGFFTEMTILFFLVVGVFLLYYRFAHHYIKRGVLARFFSAGKKKE